MARADERWIEVSKSAFAHEAQGLDLLRQIVPMSSPYRVWTNFEFMDNHGGWNEIDAVVLGRSRLHLVELKSYTGVLSGSETTWTLTGLSRHSRTQRSALITTRHKAQKLATRIREEARKVAIEHGLDAEKVLRSLPFIQECVFFHGDRFAVDLSDLAKSNLFGIDSDVDRTGLPGISERILEPPRGNRDAIGEDMSVILALALHSLGAKRRTDRDAGSWTLKGSALETGQDWQEFEAFHKVTGEKGRGRIVAMQRGAPAQARNAAHRRIHREFTLIKGLHQESIVPPVDLAVDDDGNSVLIYQDLPGFEPLDLALATRTLTAEQQIAVLAAVSEALAYAHRNQVSNRGLSPSTVLLDTENLTETADSVRVRLADWSWAGRIHAAEAASSTMLGSQTSGSGSGESDVYQAPENRWSPEADRVAVDVFALGSLAYFLLAGEAPAQSRNELVSRLRRENGLDLAASGGRFIDEQLRSLVLQATRPRVSERIDPDKDGIPQFGAAEFRARLDEYTNAHLATAETAVDPLTPIPGDLLADGRFEVVKVLGAGSTARGVLVRDNDFDGALRVLKVGLDDAAAGRLYEEAEVLTRLGALDPKVPGVVEMLEPPLDIADRTALLLTDCGEQTLSDLVRHVPAGEARLKQWGTELLDTVVALDAAGIAHRDIKPSNLGMAKAAAKGRKTKTRLALFDFSLSRAGVTAIDAGTPPYRDPFLGTGTRTAFDSAAERYSAAVVLYEMATASTPRYGDGLSDPRAITDDVSIDIVDFLDADLSEERSHALADFFRTALARDARSRHDTASAMREAWAAVFAKKVRDSGASTSTSVTRSTPRPVTPVDAFDEPAAAPAFQSLSELVAALADAAGRKRTVTRRQILELVLGTHENSPADPFVTYSDMAARVGVTPGRVAQIFGDFPGLLTSSDPLRSHAAGRLTASVTELHHRAMSLLSESGGVSTPELLARDLVVDLSQDGVDDPTRIGAGLLRFLLACEAALTPPLENGATPDPSIEAVRRQGTGTVAMLSTSSDFRQLPAALARRAEALVESAGNQGAALVPPDDADTALRREAASVLGIDSSESQIPSKVLLAIAANSSPAVSVTSRNELHAADLAVADALRVVLQGLAKTDRFGRPELETRLKARFPQLRDTLPRRPKLDDLVTTAAPGISWDEAAARYSFPDASARTGSTIPTYSQTRIPSGRTVASRREETLDLGAGERRFRALGVPQGRSDVVAEALSRRFGATIIDVTDVLLDEMRTLAARAGLDWNMILAADAGVAADREGLKGFVAQAVPAVVETVNSTTGPVILTDLSTLAAYGQLGVVSAWTDLADPPKHSIWAVVPQPTAAGGGPLIDGVALPLNSPEQFVRLTENDVKTVVAKELTV